MKTAHQIELELTQEDCTEAEAALLAQQAAEMEEAGAINPWGFEQLKESLRANRLMRHNN